jgi:hypothetical protein
LGYLYVTFDRRDSHSEVPGDLDFGTPVPDRMNDLFLRSTEYAHMREWCTTAQPHRNAP